MPRAATKQKDSQIEDEESQQEEANEEAETSDAVTYREVEKLQDVGVGAADIKKLKEAGCYTVESLRMRTKKQLWYVASVQSKKPQRQSSKGSSRFAHLASSGR